MQVLVTGNHGFIAKNLTNNLISDERYTKVYGVNRYFGYTIEQAPYLSDRFVEIYTELTNTAYVSSLFKQIQPDIIFHMAAQQGKTAEAYEANVLMTANLLKYCPQVCKFVYASSSTVYGDLASEICLTNSFAHPGCNEGLRTIPTSLYGASKLAGEGIVQAYASAGKIKPLILRYVATVGPGANHGVLPDIIKKAKSEDAIQLLGDAPGSIKPYMYVEDVVSATLFLNDNNHEGIFNVSPNDSLSIEKIAIMADTMINGMSLCPKAIRWLGKNTTPIGDNPLVSLDNRKLLGTGWQPKYKDSTNAIIKAIEEIE